MKQQVLDYLFGNRTFAAGVAIYNTLPGANKSFAARLNRGGESPQMLAQLHYELSKAVGIPEPLMRSIIDSPLQNPKVATDAEIEVPEETGETGETGGEITPAAPAPEVAQALQLFRQFPFLREAGCPPELKQLVAQKVEAFYAYQAAQPALFTAQTEEEMLAAVATTVEAYLDNQAAFAELNHYATTGQILGQHPIFALRAEIEEINAMPTVELIKKRNALVKSINTFKAGIEKGDRPDLLERRQESIAEKQSLLDVVDAAIAAKG